MSAGAGRPRALRAQRLRGDDKRRSFSAIRGAPDGRLAAS
jgi:hypothetical protein